MLEAIRKAAVLPRVSPQALVAAVTFTAFGWLLINDLIQPLAVCCCSCIWPSEGRRRAAKLPQLAMMNPAVLREVKLTLPMLPDMEIAASKTATAMAEYMSMSSG